MLKHRTAILAILLTTLAITPAFASEVGTSRKLGLGLILGLPTGPSIKYYFNERHALDAAIGFGFLSGENLLVHADYLFQFPITWSRGFDLPFYVGIGARLAFGSKPNKPSHFSGGSDGIGGVAVTVRVPLGIAFNLNRSLVDLFVEIVPGFGFFPGAGFAIGGAVGARYYF